jgi:flagellar biosynthetic protein FliR
MPVSGWGFQESSLLAFGLVLTRLASFFVFVPLPFARSTPDIARVSFALSWTIAMLPFWPKVAENQVSLGMLVCWIASEMAFGTALGLAISLLAEGVAFGAQMIATQAGYSYASSIDPNSQADSGVLLILVQLIAALFFFALGFDGRVFAALAASLERLPPGSWSIAALGGPEPWIRLSAGLFSTGLKLALPVIGLLLLIDLTLALVSRLNQQLQLLTVAFPAKMLVSLIVLGVIAPGLGLLYREQGEAVFQAIGALGK